LQKEFHQQLEEEANLNKKIIQNLAKVKIK